MICLDCKKRMKKIRTDYQYKESGLTGVMLGKITAYKCPNCGEVYPIIPNIKRLNELVAQELINKKSLLTGNELVFLRKEMKVKAKDLAEMLGVTKVSVSRWENEREPVGPACDRLIRLLYRNTKILEKCEIVRPKLERSKGIPDVKDLMISLCTLLSQEEQILKNIGKRHMHSRISISANQISARAPSHLPLFPFLPLQ